MNRFSFCRVFLLKQAISAAQSEHWPDEAPSSALTKTDPFALTKMDLWSAQ